MIASRLSAGDYRRLVTMLRVLGEAGLKPALARLGLVRTRKVQSFDAEAEAEAFVRALERLGPTFVKLGQIMATRADLLPPELTERLSRLHDDVAPVPFEEVRSQLMDDLGADPAEVFAEFSPTPIAAASIAQVYGARLTTGEPVVVKVRRPGIEEVIRADLRLLAAAARVIERRAPAFRRHQPTRVVEQLAQAILEEIDFRIEARNQEDIRGLTTVFVVPRVYRQFSTDRTLVSDRIVGTSPNSEFRLSEPALARTLAPEAAQGLLALMLREGVFHADPHPGNVLVTPEGRLALLDFGSVGRLSAKRREQVLVVLGSLVDADVGAVSDILMDWARRPGPPPLGLEPAVDQFFARYGAQSGRDIRLAEAITEFISIARENELALPPDLVLLMRAIGISEGLARTLDPDLDVIEAITPVVLQAFAERFSFKALAARGFRAFKEFDQLATTAPEALRRGMARLRREGIVVQVSIADLDALRGTVRRAGDALANAVVAAALILAGALFSLSSGGDPTRSAFSLLALGLGVIIWLVFVVRRRD
ncbi:ABC1 kinase family protein [Microvirga arsenatis]|uniref:Phosphotransferase n=1 Tax=Microvirga arsenatis TaxID=2692265 RepID=A0ABW9Z4B3_9HYPH|nr:AarF/UbiB family protein [Microvirga arsenatis]NBJ13853.1 phosphotransferase [Microvirga arsenatis]NBJ27305.1 phosphotransferase [Microvirga arsenatis]